MIARGSNSNLAFALAFLPGQKRRDMISFYAFCRVIDDIADDVLLTREQKAEGLAHWKRGITAGFAEPEELESEIVALLDRYSIPKEHLLAIIAGVSMDLDKRRYATWEELKEYCYRVASVVGLVSAEIFGYRDPACRDYAVHLGYALQLTNILRDVWQDYDTDGRIYLPGEDMESCGYGEDDLQGMIHDARFVRLMRIQCERAEACFEKAEELLPAAERDSMVAAEIMRGVYRAILDRMKADTFRVFERRYGVGTAHKLAIVAWAWLRGAWCDWNPSHKP